MADWKTNSSKIVYETAWMKVFRDEVLNQDGKPLTYSYITTNGSVYIVAVNSEGDVMLQSNYRYTLNQRMWEIPAGYIDTGESPEAAAKRELQEECGLVSDQWQHLGRNYMITAIGNVPFDVFLAEEVHKSGQHTDAEEDITSRSFTTMADIETRVANGEISDAPVVTALYMAKLNGLGGSAEK